MMVIVAAHAPGASAALHLLKLRPRGAVGSLVLKRLVVHLRQYAQRNAEQRLATSSFVATAADTGDVAQAPDRAEDPARLRARDSGGVREVGADGADELSAGPFEDYELADAAKEDCLAA
ncbi:hypothetical protein MMC29_004339 [Sticta canariensis]|nr:hypothetical protein [Sticta canariensis]